MITVLPFRAEHFARINPEPEQSAKAAPYLSPTIGRALEGPFAWTAAHDGQIIGCAGFANKWVDHWMAWAFVDQSAAPHMLEIVRVARVMRNRWPSGRIEAATPCGFTAGHRFLRLLGFELEAPLMRRYTPDGRDHALYALINGDVK